MCVKMRSASRRMRGEGTSEQVFYPQNPKERTTRITSRSFVSRLECLHPGKRQFFFPLLPYDSLRTRKFCQSRVSKGRKRCAPNHTNPPHYESTVQLASGSLRKTSLTSNRLSTCCSFHGQTIIKHSRLQQHDH